MNKNQIKELNEDSSDELGAFTGNISTDWEVDIAGNAYGIGDKSRANLADIKDGFKESTD